MRFGSPAHFAVAVLITLTAVPSAAASIRPEEQLIRGAVGVEDAALAGSRVVWLRANGNEGVLEWAGRGGPRQLARIPVPISGPESGQRPGDEVFYRADVEASASMVGIAHEGRQPDPESTVAFQEAALFRPRRGLASLVGCLGTTAPCIGSDTEAAFAPIDVSGDRAAVALRVADRRPGVLVVNRRGQRQFVPMPYLPDRVALAGRWLAVGNERTRFRVDVYDWRRRRRVTRLALPGFGHFDLQGNGTLAVAINGGHSNVVGVVPPGGRLRRLLGTPRQLMGVWIARDRVVHSQQWGRGRTLIWMHQVRMGRGERITLRDPRGAVFDFDGERLLRGTPRGLSVALNLAGP